MSSAASVLTPLGRRCGFLRARIDSMSLGVFRCSGAAASPACQMILHVIGDLLTDRRQVKHLVLDGRIIGLLGQLPIHGRLVPEIVSPIHAAQSVEQGMDNHTHETGDRSCPKVRPRIAARPATAGGTSARNVDDLGHVSSDRIARPLQSRSRSARPTDLWA
jgi:hypothetical protein